MITAGLIGEDPYDKVSIKNLLSKKYGNIRFKPVLRGIRGGGLDSAKTLRAIKQELKSQEFDLFIFIRDLDGLPSQKHLIEKMDKWFEGLKVNKKDILLLNIFELETLIFADIATFNKKYGCEIKFSGNPMMIEKPKEKLKSATFKLRKRYTESDCPEIFNALNIDTVIKNCSFFGKFVDNLDKINI